MCGSQLLREPHLQLPYELAFVAKGFQYPALNRRYLGSLPRLFTSKCTARQVASESCPSYNPRGVDALGCKKGLELNLNLELI